MKKRISVWLCVSILLLWCAAASAQHAVQAVWFEQNGEMHVLKDGDVVQARGGEIEFAIEGIEKNKQCRTYIRGLTLDGTPFEECGGFIGGDSENTVFTLTHLPGDYGPFTLEVITGEQSYSWTFSAHIDAEGIFEWAEYGVLNDAYNAYPAPYLLVKEGDERHKGASKDDMQITSPAHGSVFSGFETGRLPFIFEAHENRNGMEIQLVDPQSEEVVAQANIRSGKTGRFHSELFVDTAIPLNQEYHLRVVRESDMIEVAVTLMHEKETGAIDVQRTTYSDQGHVAQQGLTAEDLVGMVPLMTQAEYEAQRKMEGFPYDINTVNVRFEAQDDASRQYQLLAEGFNRYVELQRLDMSQFSSDKHLMRFLDADKGGSGLMRMWSRIYIRESQMDMLISMEGNEYAWDKNISMLENSYNSMKSILRSGSSYLPIDMETIGELGAQGYGQTLHAYGIASAKGIGTIDYTVRAFESQNGEIAEDKMYLFARVFTAENNEDKLAYDWLCTDQKLIAQVLTYSPSVLEYDLALAQWVARNLDDGAVQESEKVSADTAAMQIRIRKGGAVNVRSKPDADSSRVGSAQGDRVYPCLSIAENGWYEIMLDNGTTGFVSPKMGKLIQ